MKKYIKNIILFVLIGIFVISGISKNMVHMIGANLIQLAKRNYSISRTIQEIENTSVKDLNYYNYLNDINSLRLRIQNNNILEKDEDTVVKMTDGYLTLKSAYEEDEAIESCVESIKEVQQVCEDEGTDFLYVLAPEKNYFGDYPKGVKNYDVSNVDRFRKGLEESKINYLDLISDMQSNNMSLEDSFFITDHHWTPKTGFWANKKICERLNGDFGFKYNKDYLELDNYDVKTYEDWFLGSQGKKAGKYFTELGVDDFDVITPKFKTDLIEEQPLKETKREGSFEKTVLYMESVNEKDYYTLNPYAAYMGGDFRQQIVTNNLSKTNSKILVIRDSYACVVTPFLALQANETHIVDVRNFDYFYGDKVNVKEYISEINPDCVIVLYTGCPTTDDRTNFF